MDSAQHAHKVLVVDDAVAVRDRLCAWLAEDGVETVACATRRELILAHMASLRPGCVVIDVPLHDRSGFELLFELQGRFPACRVIVIMNELTCEMRKRCADAGVRHCLDKATEFERVSALVRAVGAWA
jgi:DNA-binding NtrC family response regulator